MPLARRQVLASYLLILTGFLLGIVVAGVIPIPEPPACYTATCDAYVVSSLLGLVLMIMGIVYLGIALFRAPRETETPASQVQAPVYSFTAVPTAPPTSALPSSEPASAPEPSGEVRRCASCGAQVTTDFGFCPRCGQSLPQ